jgi:hypothetical protein
MASQAFDSNDPNIAAVDATHTNGFGGPAAIIGRSDGRGVLGVSGPGQGVWGQSTTDIGTAGVSTSGPGVQGVSESGTGVVGLCTNAVAIHGVSGPSTGLRGESNSGFGVHGTSGSNTALLGVSVSGIGVHAATDSGEAAVRGDHHANGFAGFFNGKVGVTLDLNVNGNIGVMGDISLVGADVAEEFELIEGDDAEPGSVVVLAGGNRVRLSHRAYDGRVAGVISGAGGYRPGMVLDRRKTAGQWPLALVGKVWAKVDAAHAPIEVGDLLTTSATPGHAMRANDPVRAFGAVLGKALGDLRRGRGLLPVLVALQ